MIPMAIPGALVGGRQERFGFGPVEELDQSFQTAFARNGQHALDLRGVRGFLVSGVAKEGPDRGQTKVAAAMALPTSAGMGNCVTRPPLPRMAIRLSSQSMSSKTRWQTSPPRKPSRASNNRMA